MVRQGCCPSRQAASLLRLSVYPSVKDLLLRPSIPSSSCIDNPTMLAPLDERMLRSLLTYDEEFELKRDSDPREAFGENCVSGGLEYIFRRFEFFGARLDTPGAIGGAEWPDPPYWAIIFRVCDVGNHMQQGY